HQSEDVALPHGPPIVDISIEKRGETVRSTSVVHEDVASINLRDERLATPLISDVQLDRRTAYRVSDFAQAIDAARSGDDAETLGAQAARCRCSDATACAGHYSDALGFCHLRSSLGLLRL